MLANSTYLKCKPDCSENTFCFANRKNRFGFCSIKKQVLLAELLIKKIEAKSGAGVSDELWHSFSYKLCE